ncbi:Trk system potassium transporter TrkA [Parabacteroides sp. OttesenSCG-928-G06]|nr:Trk system potassium transporter TrkA [Parabacteroides sp. OttesenSCG-928-K15]MDL2281512.1 Trk system potassium transporter TrkA [Parabacteroides sp. OttesenSCG-928-G06]
MKIIIAGAGAVGTHLAKMLSQEKMDIILMDEDEDRLVFPNSNMDILPVVGNPNSLRNLEEAGVSGADLFISVTPEETANVMACVLAHNLGAKRTVARINNYEYLLPKNKEFFENLGVNTLIYPEMLAAKEIVSDIRRPWTRQYWELFGGALILIGVKVRDNSWLVNKQISELPSEDKQYHVVAIKRQHETIIPRGSDKILSGDLLFFTTTKANVEEVRKQAGKEDPEVKKIIIMGGSRIAIRACQYLPNHIRIRLIELDKEKSHRIAEIVPGNVLVINGDGRDPDLLKQEGIKDSQAFIALTENASTNILACLAAKRYGVFKTIAGVENMDYISMAESMDIGAVINKKQIAASYIYQFLLDADVTNVKCLTFANADVAELVARSGSKITRKMVKDLKLPAGMTLGGIIRDGEPMLVNGNTQIQACDHVVVFCLDSAMRKLEDYFN